MGTNSFCCGSGFPGGVGSGSTFMVVSGAMINGANTEAFYQYTAQKSCTFSHLGYFIGASFATCNLAFRKNTAAGNQLCATPSGTTAWVTDSTHSDSIVAGNVINLQMFGTGNKVNFAGHSMIQNGTTPTVQYQGGYFNAGAYATSKKFTPILGSLVNSSTSETGGYTTYLQEAGTLSEQGFVIYSGSSGAVTHTFRKNGADGNQTLAIASGTGFFQDTTHTDSISAGDHCDTSYISLSATGGYAMSGYNFAGTTAGHDIGTSVDTQFGSTSSFFNFSGRSCVMATTPEGPFNLYIQYSTTASRLTMWGQSTISASIAFRKNSGAGNQSVSLSSSAGPTTDVTHTDSLAANDNFDGSYGTGNLTTAGATVALNDGSVSLLTSKLFFHSMPP